MRSDRRPISPCSGISVGISVDVVSLGPVISSASPFSTSIITRFLPRYNKRLKSRTFLPFLNRYTHTRVNIFVARERDLSFEARHDAGFGNRWGVEESRYRERERRGRKARIIFNGANRSGKLNILVKKIFPQARARGLSRL